MADERDRDWWLLLACGLAACGPSTDGATGGPHEAEVDQAIDACADYAKKLDECYADAGSGSYGYGGYGYLVVLGYCISYFGYAQSIGPACQHAMEETYACISRLDCDVIVGGDGDTTTGAEPPPCEAEYMAFDAACASTTSG